MMKLFLLAALVAVAVAASVESNDPAPVHGHHDANPLKVESSLLQTKTLLAKEPNNCLVYCRNVLSNLLTQWSESFNVTK